MEKRLCFLSTVLVLAPAMGNLDTVRSASPQEVKTQKISKEQCLGCHGAYEKLRERTKNYKAASGEIVTPHQYVPHLDAREIPECTECHTPHIVPLKDKSTVIKPKDLGFCHLVGCHHLPNLQSCKTCHGG